MRGHGAVSQQRVKPLGLELDHPGELEQRSCSGAFLGLEAALLARFQTERSRDAEPLRNDQGGPSAIDAEGLRDAREGSGLVSVRKMIRAARAHEATGER